MPLDSTRFQLDIAREPDAIRLRLGGELDADSVDALSTTGQRLFEEGNRRLVLDCSGLTFCDSFGLRAITDFWRLAQPDGSVTVVRPSQAVMRLCRITGLDALLSIGPVHGGAAMQATGEGLPAEAG